jgi:FkbM family methyltransferase
MKIKTFIPRKFRKKMWRIYRFNPIFEWLRSCLFLRTLLQFQCRTGVFSVMIDKNDILIDCGANVGDVTSQMANTGALVYAFEPDPFAYNVLKKRFRFIKNVKILNAGIMDQAGQFSFHLCASNVKDAIDCSVGSSFLAEKNTYTSGTIKVDCIRLVDFLLALGKKVKLIKMDIEGAEIAVLNDLFSNSVIDCVDYMLVETHERQMPVIKPEIDKIRRFIEKHSLGDKIRLDWV